MTIALTYLAVVNLVTFFLYGIDKWKAKRSKWRIEESTLLWWAAFGGSIGALLGMKAWHHKTQHKKTGGYPAQSEFLGCTHGRHWYDHRPAAHHPRHLVLQALRAS